MVENIDVQQSYSGSEKKDKKQLELQKLVEQKPSIPELTAVNKTVFTQTGEQTRLDATVQTEQIAMPQHISQSQQSIRKFRAPDDVPSVQKSVEVSGTSLQTFMRNSHQSQQDFRSVRQSRNVEQMADQYSIPVPVRRVKTPFNQEGATPHDTYYRSYLQNGPHTNRHAQRVSKEKQSQVSDDSQGKERHVSAPRARELPQLTSRQPSKEYVAKNKSNHFSIRIEMQQKEQRVVRQSSKRSSGIKLSRNKKPKAQNFPVKMKLYNL